MVMQKKLPQSLNAFSFSIVNETGKDVHVRLLHLQKTQPSFFWILFGMVIVCSLLDLNNACALIAEMSEDIIATSTSVYGDPLSSDV